MTTTYLFKTPKQTVAFLYKVATWGFFNKFRYFALDNCFPGNVKFVSDGRRRGEGKRGMESLNEEAVFRENSS